MSAVCSACGETLTRRDSVSLWLSVESGPYCPAAEADRRNPARVHLAEPAEEREAGQ